jgi:hypothetical protein
MSRQQKEAPSVRFAIGPPRDVCLDRSDLGFATRHARRANWHYRKDPSRARRQEEHAVAEANRIVRVVGDKQCQHGTAVHQRGDLVAQTGGKGIVERRQRLVEDTGI